MSSAEIYQQEKTLITDTQARLEQLETELASAYERWEYLDDLVTG